MAFLTLLLKCSILFFVLSNYFGRVSRHFSLLNTLACSILKEKCIILQHVYLHFEVIHRRNILLATSPMTPARENCSEALSLCVLVFVCACVRVFVCVVGIYDDVVVAPPRALSFVCPLTLMTSDAFVHPRLRCKVILC